MLSVTCLYFVCYVSVFCMLPVCILSVTCLLFVCILSVFHVKSNKCSIEFNVCSNFPKTGWLWWSCVTAGASSTSWTDQRIPSEWLKPSFSLSFGMSVSKVHTARHARYDFVRLVHVSVVYQANNNWMFGSVDINTMVCKVMNEGNLHNG